MSDYLVRIEITLPPDMNEEERRSLLEAEQAVGRQLVERGVIAAIWRLPGRRANVGIWHASDATELHGLISSLPLLPWMKVEVTELAMHDLMSKMDG